VHKIPGSRLFLFICCRKSLIYKKDIANFLVIRKKFQTVFSLILQSNVFNMLNWTIRGTFQDNLNDAVRIHFNAFHRKTFKEWTLSTSNNRTETSITMCLGDKNHDGCDGCDSEDNGSIYFVAKSERNITAHVTIRYNCNKTFLVSLKVVQNIAQCLPLSSFSG